MSSNKEFLNVLFQQVHDQVKQEGYASYDPYDGPNTQIGLLRKFYATRLFLTYFNKFSPVNFRPLLGIPKSRQNQCLAFIGLALAQYDPEKYREDIAKIAEIIKSETLIEQYGFHCWEAHGFYIQMRGKLREPGQPDVVGCEACGRLLVEHYKLTGDKHALEQAKSFRDFLVEGFYTEYKHAPFFKYKPGDPQNKCTYNASVIAGSYILYINSVTGEDHGRDQVLNVFRYVAQKQKADGRWNYAVQLDSGQEKPQIDFHQGFILDAFLDAISQFPEESELESAYSKGLEFYFNQQFHSSGRSYYRLPKKWPVNIHNQSQGIITFTKAARAGFGDNYLNFAKTIADWTIRNMQGRDGHFYYMKYPFFTNKIPYIRWSDTNMLYAMATYLNYKSK